MCVCICACVVIKRNKVEGSTSDDRNKGQKSKGEGGTEVFSCSLKGQSAKKQEKRKFYINVWTV